MLLLPWISAVVVAVAEKLRISNCAKRLHEMVSILTRWSKTSGKQEACIRILSGSDYSEKAQPT